MKRIVRKSRLNLEYCRICKLLSETANAIEAVRHSYKLSKADSRSLRIIALDCTAHDAYIGRLEILSRPANDKDHSCRVREAKIVNTKEQAHGTR